MAAATVPIGTATIKILEVEIILEAPEEVLEAGPCREEEVYGILEAAVQIYGDNRPEAVLPEVEEAAINKVSCFFFFLYKNIYFDCNYLKKFSWKNCSFLVLFGNKTKQFSIDL